jgi:hypothetical protein
MKLWKLLIIIISVLAVFALWVWAGTRPVPLLEMGEPPEFRVILVDNGDNDFLIFVFLKEGTMEMSVPNPFFLNEVAIYKNWRENDILIKIEGYVAPVWLGEPVKIPLNADVLKEGEYYRFQSRYPVLNIPKIKCI